MKQRQPIRSFSTAKAVKFFYTCLPILILPTLSQAAGQCINLFNQEAVAIQNQSSKRGLPEIKLNWHDDLSFIEANQKLETLGLVDTYFSTIKDTQVYYTKTAAPNSKGQVPLIDPQTKAVFIFFHGSGTMKSGGRNFISNMNTLAKLGYSALSVDMPFHSEGPRDPRFNNAFYFMEWTKSIVDEAKKTGKPVILAGHSFGPDVILEFATRYPKSIDGVVALSPAGFTKELSHWYDNFTTKMKFGGEVAENEAGGLWAGAMSKQFLWSKERLADPTQVNQNLKLRILSGNREEYVPAPIGGENRTPIGENTYDVSIPLKRIFKNATVTIEPGIGHYLFEHTDKNGHNVVLRELLAAVDVRSEQVKSLTESTRQEAQNVVPSVQLGKKYYQDKVFQTWFNQNYKPDLALRIFNQGNDILAQKIVTDYNFALKDRNNIIFQKILATKNTDPSFYEKYRSFIDKMNPKTVDTTLFPAYAQHLKGRETID